MEKLESNEAKEIKISDLVKWNQNQRLDNIELNVNIINEIECLQNVSKNSENSELISFKNFGIDEDLERLDSLRDWLLELYRDECISDAERTMKHICTLIDVKLHYEQFRVTIY